MRRILSFKCEGATLAATLDEAAGESGLLIVSGGNEIRTGAHRGMAKLARDVAAEGHPVFRFDRRGIGDSEGNNGGFESSADDLKAAITAFRAACPHVKSIFAFGNCDAASALLLHRPEGLSGHLLANIWVIEPVDELPPQAAIRARYLERMRDPKAWLGLFTGAINLGKLMRGLGRLASKPSSPTGLADRIAAGLAAATGPIEIILSSKDGTAIAFQDAWNSEAFAAARARKDLALTTIDSPSHSFASDEDYAALKSAILKALRSA